MNTNVFMNVGLCILFINVILGLVSLKKDELETLSDYIVYGVGLTIINLLLIVPIIIELKIFV